MAHKQHRELIVALKPVFKHKSAVEFVLFPVVYESMKVLLEKPVY